MQVLWVCGSHSGIREVEGGTMKRLEEVQAEPVGTMEGLISQGGRAHRVRSAEGRMVDSMIALYKNRLTFTFVMDNEVASIHFDKERGEIFLKGHNIMNMTINTAQKEALERLGSVLKEDAEGKAFLEEYEATLAKAIADNYSEG